MDARIEAFLAAHFAELNLNSKLRLPGRTFVPDRRGIAGKLPLAVPNRTFAELFRGALRPREASTLLPFTANRSAPTRAYGKSFADRGQTR